MAKLYHDVEVVERTEITPAGKIVKVYRVSAYTAKETRFTINVPEKQFIKESVDKLLAERASFIDEIQDL